ncbi:MAG: inorganic phosphate transporter, partial [Acidimicrobiales bacterium]
ASTGLADRLTRHFSTGIVEVEPDQAFTVAILLGVAGWVAVATVARLPVSTTHAIVGALLGAGLVEASGSIRWASLTGRVAVPLLVSIAAAFGLASLANALGRPGAECVCAQPASALGCLGAVPIRGTAGSTAECRIHRRGPNLLRGLHWLSSGAASFARGLNDTPKIAAIAAFALVPAGWSPSAVALLVGASMAVGSVLVGCRVARRLAEDVVRMDEGEGTRSSVVLSVLVGVGANRGLPMSTTHVATGAIAGASGGRLARLDTATLGGFGLAWVTTLPVSAAIAAAALAAVG